MKYSHLFGPVHSRRLGISLGVDMMPLKVCTINCVYCECGKTTKLTVNRKEYVSGNEIISELSDYLHQKPKLDYVTFAGSGEPTLNTALGKCISFVKNEFPEYKTALLTNGTLFTIPEVRKEVITCDLICPSLDAISDEAFSKVNRPHPSLDNKCILEGLKSFSKEYKGNLWMEVFIVPGLNDNPEELNSFKSELLEINPTRVQLNSLDRPGACEWVKVAPPEALKKIAEYLSPLPVEIISRNSRDVPQSEVPGEEAEQTVLSLLKRRPSTIEELSSVSGITINRLSVLLDKLLKEEEVGSEMIANRCFYRICNHH
ncbi:MAG TPA: radical SAM protein [Chitinispirillaceae bacterium]|nr:radical SAM protein [Chitinispirillaceae bacterium]